MPPGRGALTSWDITSSGATNGPGRRASRSSKTRCGPRRGAPKGRASTDIITDVNRTLRGWFGYFKHSHRSTFPLDGWVRMRLRSILRKRQAARPGRGADHHRWPNTYFAKQGLFSLSAAHAMARQSLAGEPPTGEPYAGDPPVRFGGRGSSSLSLPLSILKCPISSQAGCLHRKEAVWDEDQTKDKRRES